MLRGDNNKKNEESGDRAVSHADRVVATDYLALYKAIQLDIDVSMHTLQDNKDCMAFAVEEEFQLFHQHNGSKAAYYQTLNQRYPIQNNDLFHVDNLIDASFLIEHADPGGSHDYELDFGPIINLVDDSPSADDRYATLLADNARLQQQLQEEKQKHQQEVQQLNGQLKAVSVKHAELVNKMVNDNAHYNQHLRDLVLANQQLQQREHAFNTYINQLLGNQEKNAADMQKLKSIVEELADCTKRSFLKYFLQKPEYVGILSAHGSSRNFTNMIEKIILAYIQKPVGGPKATLFETIERACQDLLPNGVRLSSQNVFTEQNQTETSTQTTAANVRTALKPRQ